MPAFAVVPVQRLDTAKSRLAAAISPEDRRQLVIELLDNVLRALTSASRIDEIIVVSPDPDVLRYVAQFNVHPLEQLGRGLNDAIRLGRNEAMDRGADTLLVVLADLPRLTAIELDELLTVAEARVATMAPDRHGHGTNALVLRPPDAIEPAFGVNSFHKHQAEAERQGIPVQFFHTPGTSFDIDTIDDLEDLGWLSERRRGERPRFDHSRCVLNPGNVYPSSDTD